MQTRSKHSNFMLALLICGAALTASFAGSFASAQHGPGCRGGGGWGSGGPYGRMYDLKTIETLSGEVVAVESFLPMKPMCGGVHLQLKTDKETISVHLGPAWFIDNQEVTLSAHDKIQVKGSRVTFNGKPAIIAAEVTKGEELLKLRDDKGVPVWAGWRRR